MKLGRDGVRGAVDDEMAVYLGDGLYDIIARTSVQAWLGFGGEMMKRGRKRKETRDASDDAAGRSSRASLC